MWAIETLVVIVSPADMVHHFWISFKEVKEEKALSLVIKELEVYLKTFFFYFFFLKED